MNYLRPIVAFAYALLSFGLGACATNMSNVATFGDATTAVAQQTTIVLPKVAPTCSELRSLIGEQRRIAAAALAHAEESQKAASAQAKGHPKHGARASSSQPSAADLQKSLSGYVASLTNIDSPMKQSCDRLTSFKPQLEALSASLASYATAIKALAQDEFVTYRPELDTLPKSIGAIPAGKSTLLTSEQVDAISGLDALVYKAATESYRQAKLKDVLNNDEPLIRVVNKLQDVTVKYSYELATLASQGGTAVANAKALQREGLLLEPIGVQEFAVRVQAQQALTKDREDALTAYAEVLKKVQPALEKVRDSVNHPPAKDLVAEVKDFAQAAYNVQQKLRDAF